MEQFMDMEQLTSVALFSTKESFKMVKVLDLVNIDTKEDLSTEVNGKMI